ncbi:hypothetical protein I4U23_004580 [Adineta vaga]|nr:hypothetical protein I4U23_004580 [Adineta vaga]
MSALSNCMEKRTSLIFVMDSELNKTVNALSIPKPATIFFSDDQWWYELRENEDFTKELQRRTECFNQLKRSAVNIQFALGPFDFQKINLRIQYSQNENRFSYLITSINDRKWVNPIGGIRSPNVITHMQFVEQGILEGAYINANEQFDDPSNPERKYIPTQYGGFLYLFNKDKSAHDQDCYFELIPIMLGETESNG